MTLLVMRSAAALLGAFACAFLVYEFLTVKKHKANRSAISKSLSGAPIALGKSSAREDSLAQKILQKIPFIAPALKREEQQRKRERYRAELPKMFEIVALGMRVGLGFDQAFARYVHEFSTPLAQQCRERFEIWEQGLITRESGLRDLAAHIDLKEFDRFTSLTLRALDCGAPLTHLLYDLADGARKSYRSERQEKVAKAPVKMLIPTGALILPAMMMLVLGPIIIDITGRMV